MMRQWRDQIHLPVRGSSDGVRMTGITPYRDFLRWPAWSPSSGNLITTSEIVDTPLQAPRSAWV